MLERDLLLGYSYTTIALSQAPIQRDCNSIFEKMRIELESRLVSLFRAEQTRNNTAIRAGGGGGGDAARIAVYETVSAEEHSRVPAELLGWYAEQLTCQSQRP